MGSEFTKEMIAADWLPRYPTVFLVGHQTQIAGGALLLVSDIPTTPDGVETEGSDICNEGEAIKHFEF